METDKKFDQTARSSPNAKVEKENREALARRFQKPQG